MKIEYYSLKLWEYGTYLQEFLNPEMYHRVGLQKMNKMLKLRAYLRIIAEDEVDFL